MPCRDSATPLDVVLGLCGVARFLLAVRGMVTRVTLVSGEPNDKLVRYLMEVGFVVRPVRTPAAAPHGGMLVWLTDPQLGEAAIADAVRRWLGTTPSSRAIVVTDRPVRLREVTDERVWLLPAPVFGWQLVDVLRDAVFSAS